MEWLESSLILQIVSSLLSIYFRRQYVTFWIVLNGKLSSCKRKVPYFLQLARQDHFTLTSDFKSSV